MGKGNSQIMAINLMISMRTVVSGRYNPPFAEVCLRFGARTHEREGTGRNPHVKGESERNMWYRYYIRSIGPRVDIKKKARSALNDGGWAQTSKRRRGNALFRASRLELTSIVDFHPPPNRPMKNSNRIFTSRGA